MSEGVENWVLPLRDAARGAARAHVDTLRGARPRLLDASNANAVTSVVLAAFVTSASVFRAQVAEASFDLIASALRVLAVAFLVRASIAVARGVRSAWLDRKADQASLALSEDGLLLVMGDFEVAVARADVLDVTFEDPLPSRTLSPRPSPVLVVLRPRDGKPRTLHIPPYFAPSAEILTARLKRWLPASGERPLLHRSVEAPVGDPEQRYQRGAEGRLEDGDTVIPEGQRYLLRAPFVALLGLVFALDVWRTAGEVRSLVFSPVLAACGLCLAAVVAWFLWMWRRRATRLGIGMLLTRAELLLRGPGGVVAVPWPQLQSIEVSLKARWSPFLGPYPTRLLTLTTQEQQRMVFDESFLAVSVAALSVLLHSYRDAWSMPR